jgi:aminopeptidase
MSDPRAAFLARLLTTYCTAVRPGDWVLVQSHPIALPLVEQVVAEVARAGGHPTVMLNSETLEEAYLRNAGAAQLDWLSPADVLTAERVDVRININATGNTRSLTGVDPAQQQRLQNARRRLSQTYMERSAAGQHRWVGTLFPCPAFAQDADMSLADYEDFVFGATFCDQPDPAACWRALGERQQRLVEWLKGKSEVKLRSQNIDMTLSIAGRNFVNSDGRRNMPSGEIFTGPVEDSANGWVRFSFPAIRGGREVDGVEFEFKDGRVVRASATKNQAYLLSQLDSDEGSRFLGEFAFGANEGIQRFTKNILFDEKIGGTIHMALGAGYPETGSKNRSSVHWDFICDMRQESEVWVDGELFCRNGSFVID